MQRGGKGQTVMVHADLAVCRPASLGVYLQELRSRRGLTLTEASLEIGVHRDHLYKLEHNKREPLLRSAARIAEFYGVSVDSMVKCMGDL